MNDDSFDKPGMLIAADEPDARERLAEAALICGARVLDAVPVDAANAAVADRAAVDVFAISFGSGLNEARVEALAEVIDEVGAERCLIVATLDEVDRLWTIAGDSEAELLADPDAGALAAGVGRVVRRRREAALHEDRPEAGELRRLSEEAGRIARVLDTLATEADIAEPAAPLTAPRLRAILRARRLRDRFFTADLFADPAWDMLLDLMAARMEETRVSISSLCIAAAVPPTTALRWIREMLAAGLLVRNDDPADGRRAFIALAEPAAQAMTAYFAALERQGLAII